MPVGSVYRSATELESARQPAAAGRSNNARQPSSDSLARRLRRPADQFGTRCTSARRTGTPRCPPPDQVPQRRAEAPCHSGCARVERLGIDAMICEPSRGRTTPGARPPAGARSGDAGHPVIGPKSMMWRAHEISTVGPFATALDPSESGVTSPAGEGPARPAGRRLMCQPHSHRSPRASARPGSTRRPRAGGQAATSSAQSVLVAVLVSISVVVADVVAGVRLSRHDLHPVVAECPRSGPDRHAEVAGRGRARS